MDLTIVDSRNGSSGPIAVARFEHSMAIEPLDPILLDTLRQKKEEINKIILGKALRFDEKTVNDFGYDLFKLATPKKIERIFRRQPRNSVITMKISSDHEVVRSLPWEFMQDPDLPGGPKPNRSLVRIVPTIETPFTPLEIKKRPLNVLFVWSQPQQLASLDWAGVKKRLETNLAVRLPDRFKLNIVNSATPMALANELRANSYDVLHFCGHGRTNAGIGELLFQSLNGTGVVPQTAEEFANLVSGRGLQLVVIGACNSSTGSFHPFSSVAETLVQTDIPAVVANQFAIRISSLAVFTNTLYEELLKHGNIDRSVAEARSMVYANMKAMNQDALDWGIPNVYRHSAAAELFRV